MADGAAQLIGVFKINRVDGRNRTCPDALGSDLAMQSDTGQDSEFGPRVQTIDVVGGISLRES